jgi:hypothetical protein
MNCAQCEERMSDYFESALGATDILPFESHLQSCAACTELLSGMKEVLGWAKSFPVFDAPPWLATRIVANTPRVAHESWRDTLRSVWGWIVEPRAAMAVFTATLVLGWLGGLAGISPNWGAIVRDPSSIYYSTEGALNRAYDGAIRAYYRSPLVSQIQSRIQQLREIS